jgi:steroid delta-isomerase-like uncharacterized protein
MPVMGREDILALLERRNAAWTARDPAALAATHAPEGVVDSPTGGHLKGRDEIERVYRVWLTAFPDIAWQPEETVIDGDRAVVLAKIVGTHAGAFFGLPAAGRHIDIQVAIVLTVEDGLVATERRIYDFTGLLVQTGVLKAKPVG